MSEANPEFPEVEATPVDPEKIKNYKSEAAFVALSTNLLAEATSYACISASTLGSTPTWNRNMAAVGGSMVRLYKLLCAILDQTHQQRREISFILARLAFETSVTVRYLIAFFSPALLDSYVQQSLRHEKKLFDEIHANISARGGEIWPIETRMLRSIQKAAEVAEVDLGTIEKQQNWGGKSTYQRADAIGLRAAHLAFFSGASHHVHGSWHDLSEYHLAPDPRGGFVPALEWSEPRPQLLLALTLLTLETVRDYLRFVGGDATLQILEAALSDLEARLEMVNEAHEAFLIARMGDPNHPA